MLTTVNISQYELTEIEVLYSIGTNRIKVNLRMKGKLGNLPASAGET